MAILVGIGLMMPTWAQLPLQSALPNESQTEPLEEVLVTALEPRYVAPTLFDRIGRIWAPVYINEQGPFRLVLDTGATHSAIIQSVADTLQLEPDPKAAVQLRAATGSAVVPTVKIDSLRMGDLLLKGKKLPIISTALGGADGVLGTEGLDDKRIDIDFRRDRITITRSQRQRADPGFVTIPIDFARGKLLTTTVYMGGVRMKAIIDTGGQATIANLAARAALQRAIRKNNPSVDNIVGATQDIEIGQGYPVPPIIMGDVRINSAHMTFLDLHIFKYWQYIDEPAVLIGMDVIGLLDRLIIDYRREELQLKVRS